MSRRSAKREGGLRRARQGISARRSAGEVANIVNPDSFAGRHGGARRMPCRLARSHRERARRGRSIGEVAKRSNAADCKSVAPAASEVRILPSPPDFARWLRRRASSGQASERSLSRRSAKRERAKRRKRDSGPARRSVTAKAVRVGGSNSVVESQPSKLLVAGS